MIKITRKELPHIFSVNHVTREPFSNAATKDVSELIKALKTNGVTRIGVEWGNPEDEFELNPDQLQTYYKEYANPAERYSRAVRLNAERNGIEIIPLRGVKEDALDLLSQNIHDAVVKGVTTKAEWNKHVQGLRDVEEAYEPKRAKAIKAAIQTFGAINQDFNSRTLNLIDDAINTHMSYLYLQHALNKKLNHIAVGNFHAMDLKNSHGVGVTFVNLDPLNQVIVTNKQIPLARRGVYQIFKPLIERLEQAIDESQRNE